MLLRLREPAAGGRLGATSVERVDRVLSLGGDLETQRLRFRPVSRVAIAGDATRVLTLASFAVIVGVRIIRSQSLFEPHAGVRPNRTACLRPEITPRSTVEPPSDPVTS